MLIFCDVIKLLLPVIVIAEVISLTESKAATSETCVKKKQHNSYTDTTENKKRKAQPKKQTYPNCTGSSFALDCADFYRAGYLKSGVRKVWPKSRDIEDVPFYVYCDMETDGGGWTVIQRRGNFSRPKDDFFRDWNEYKMGFGSVDRDFWLGNNKIYALTSQRLYSARFDLKDVYGDVRYALYDVFWIGNEETKYKLHIRDYSGNAGDSMTEDHDGQKFSTKDQDNDSDGGHCANHYKGAWWYKRCYQSHLNGLYLYGKHEGKKGGVVWGTWKGIYESLAETEIKIRPKNFIKAPIVNYNHMCVDDEFLRFAG